MEQQQQTAEKIREQRIKALRQRVQKATSKDVNNPGDGGETLLHEAVKLKDDKSVCDLIQKSADVNKKNDSGNTPIHLLALSPVQDPAEGNSVLEIYRLFFKKNADFTLPNKIGYTPLHCAAQTGNRQVCEYLIGLNTNAPHTPLSMDGSYPIHLAAENGHLEIVKLFIEQKNPVIKTGSLFAKTPSMKELKNKEGKTAYDLAFKKGKTEIAEYLKPMSTKKRFDLSKISRSEEEEPITRTPSTNEEVTIKENIFNTIKVKLINSIANLLEKLLPTKNQNNEQLIEGLEIMLSYVAQNKHGDLLESYMECFKKAAVQDNDVKEMLGNYGAYVNQVKKLPLVSTDPTSEETKVSSQIFQPLNIDEKTQEEIDQELQRGIEKEMALNKSARTLSRETRTLLRNHDVRVRKQLSDLIESRNNLIGQLTLGVLEAPFITTDGFIKPELKEILDVIDSCVNQNKPLMLSEKQIEILNQAALQHSEIKQIVEAYPKYDQLLKEVYPLNTAIPAQKDINSN